MKKILEYSLIQKKIFDNDQAYTGIIRHGMTADKKRIVDIMVDRGTSLTRTDINAVLNLFYQTVADELREGNVVSTPIFRAELSLKGVFSLSSEKYNPKKHKPHVTIRPAKGLNKNVTYGLGFHRARRTPGSFFISYVVPLNPECNNFYPSTSVLIQGKSLKVFHTPASYRVELRQKLETVAQAEILRITSGRVIATLPHDLKPGWYNLYFIKEFSGKKYERAAIAIEVLPRG